MNDSFSVINRIVYLKIYKILKILLLFKKKVNYFEKHIYFLRMLIKIYIFLFI